MRKAKNVLLYLWATHGAGFRWINSIFLFVGYFGMVVTLTTVTRAFTTSWPGQREFALYLYITYFTTAFGWAGLLLVSRQLWHNLSDTSEQRDQAVAIQHRLAEVVRRYAYDLKHDVPFKKLEHDVELHDILGEISDYLWSKLRRKDIHIAVKHMGGTADSRTLDAIIRHPFQPDRTKRVDIQPVARSLIWKNFGEGTRERQRVMIGDVLKLDRSSDQNVEYINYATQCDFRSVLAFPLRRPKTEKGETTSSGIVGFVSFDCPDAYGFDGLFRRKLFTRKSNDGNHLKDNPDIQFFFGVADSLASLVVMGAR